MRKYPIGKVRDIGIIAHHDASLVSTRSLTPLGFSISATGNYRFPTPSLTNVRLGAIVKFQAYAA